MTGIHYHRDQRLEQRVRALLGQLRLLSEAESTSVVHFQKKSAKAASRAPKGAFRGRGPDPDEGLLTWFLHRLERTRGGPALNALCAEGEVRLAKRLKRQPGREAGAGFVGSRESAEDRDKRIVDSYVGLDPSECRVIESERSGFVSEANIRLVRLRAKRNPEDGQPQSEPESFDDKKKLARSLKAEGVTHSEIAIRVGVARQTVIGWLKANGGSKAA